MGERFSFCSSTTSENRRNRVVLVLRGTVPRDALKRDDAGCCCVGEE